MPSAAQLWLVAVPERVAESDLAVLADADREAMLRLQRAEDRARFATRRIAMRRLVARALGIAPAAVALDRTCRHCGAMHGKPRIVNAGDHDVSASSSGRYAAVALVAGGEVGVDLASDDQHVPDAAFAAGERDVARIVSWCCKEAVLKANGFGLAIEPAHVEIARRDARLVVAAAPRSELFALSLHTGTHDGHVWAVALRPDRDVAATVIELAELR